MNKNMDMQGFRQSRGVDQGGNPWYDDGVDEETFNPDDYLAELTKVPLNRMIFILQKLGYTVIHPEEEKHEKKSF